MKYIFLSAFSVFIFCLSSCQSRMICPAFQSSFIYNDVKREKLFTYFGEDSLPSLPGYTSKNKYGIIEGTSKRKKNDHIRIVKMEKIYPEKDEVKDSLTLALNTFQEGEGGDLDSLVNAAPEKLYHYNVEQENYNRLFGKYLYKPPPPESDEIEEETEQDAVPQEEDLSRKERRQARKEGKAKEKQEALEDTEIKQEEE